MVKDYGNRVVPLKGVKIKSNHHFYVNHFGTYSAIYFKIRGVYYTLFGNLPLPEILSVADSFKAI